MKPRGLPGRPGRPLQTAVRVLLFLLAGHGLVRADEALLEHGRYVFFAAGCVSCHGAGQTLAAWYGSAALAATIPDPFSSLIALMVRFRHLPPLAALFPSKCRNQKARIAPSLASLGQRRSPAIAFAKVSRSPTVRLNTRRSSATPASRQK